MQGLWLLIGVLLVVAIVLLGRGPYREWRKHRSDRQRDRKRAWRRERDETKARFREEHAMNPERAARRKPPPTWQKVMKSQGSKCWLCGTRTYADDVTRQSSGRELYGATYPTVDYVTPLARGGSNALDNLRIAHRHCARVRAENPAQTKFGTPPRTYGATS